MFLSLPTFLQPSQAKVRTDRIGTGQIYELKLMSKTVKELNCPPEQHLGRWAVLNSSLLIHFSASRLCRAFHSKRGSLKGAIAD